MVNFKTFFSEGLGLFPKTAKLGGVIGALKEPLTPAEQQKMQHDRDIIGKYKQSRGEAYPDGKYNFQLVDDFKSMVSTAWRALPLPGQTDSNPYSILLLGDPGIGKSHIIKDSAKKLSDAENKKVPSYLPDGSVVKREFVEWNKLSDEKKLNVMDNPEKYYLFMDLRSAYLTTAGMEGLPVPENQRKNKSQFFKSLPQQFISVISNPELAGVLFLDEVNQASSEVFSMLYQIINDRVFKDTPISPRILVLAAANLLGGGTTTTEMGPALSTRFIGAVLVPDPDSWFKWAGENGIDNVILDYVRTDPENTFFKYPSEEGNAQQWPNPRAIVRFNTQFKNKYNEYEELQQQDPTGELARQFQFREKVTSEAKSGLGIEWGEGFGQFLKNLTDIDLEKLASSEEEYKKLPSITKQQASTSLIQAILQEIDDSVTSPVKSKEVGSPPLLTYPVDEQKLDANLSKVAKKLMLNNSPEANEKILKAIKKRQPDYCAILLDYLVKDDAMFKVLSSLEASLPEKNVQI